MTITHICVEMDARYITISLLAFGLLPGVYDCESTNMNTEDILVKEITALIRCLHWTSMAIFYDNSTEVYERLVTELSSSERQILPITVDIMTSVHAMDEVLSDLHGLFPKTINVLLLCREDITTRLLSVANTIDARHSRLLNYQHRSSWLIVAPGSMVEVVKTISSNIDNIAILSVDSIPCRTCGTISNPLLQKPRWCEADSSCRDRYLISAVGVMSHRSWHWYLYSSLHQHNTSCLTTVFPNSMYGYNGREILVVTRDSGSCSSANTAGNVTTHSGYCFDILTHITSALNLSYRVIKSPDNSWGRLNEDGTWTGMMGELNRGDADIIIADITFHDDRTKILDFLLPGLGEFKEVVLYRKSMDRELSLVSFLDPFHTFVYVVLLGVLLVAPVLFYIIERALVQRDDPLRLQDVYFFFVGGVFQQSGDLVTVSWSARSVVASFWIGSLCLSVFYTAYLTASLTTGKEVQPFTNIEELVKNNEYKLGTKGRGPSFTAIKTAKNKPLSDVWLKIVESNKSDSSVIERDLDLALDKVLNDKYAIILNDRLARLAMTTDCRFDILKDIIMWQQYSFAIRKNSPYKEDFERIFSRVVDTGLARRAQEQAEEDLARCGKLKGDSVDMSYMLGKLSVLVIGTCLATLVLVVEHIVRRIWTYNKPRNSFTTK